MNLQLEIERKRRGHKIQEHRKDGNIENLLKSGELKKTVTSNLTLKVPHFSSNIASKPVITCKEVFSLF
jgi:hypothetical protein